MLDTIKMEDLPTFKYGEEIGIGKGKIEGIEEGEKRGIEKEKLHIALNMLKAGIDIKDIALLTELNIEEIEELKKKIKS